MYGYSLKRDTNTQTSLVSDDIKQLIAGYRLRYIFALSSVGVLVVSGFIIIQLLLSLQHKDGGAINMAGAQRMLSQKIAFYSSVHQKTYIKEGQ